MNLLSDVGGDVMKWKMLLIFALMMSLMLVVACGDDDDDDNDDVTPDDDTVDDDDDDTVDDDDDDTGDDDDDTVDDDTSDDDTGDDDTAPTCDWENYNALMVEGKTALGDFDPATAAEKFAEAVELCPEVGDAQLGDLLAQFQNIMKTLAEVFAEYPDFPFIDWVAFQEDVVNDLMPLNEEFVAAAIAMETDFPQNRLFVPSLPILIIEETVVVDCGGEWDYADFINLAAVGNLVDAIESFLLAFELEADWSLLEDFPYLYDPIEVVHWYCGQILEMFADPLYPDFMTFTEDGPEYFADFAIALGFAAIDGEEGFAAVLLETDPQGDDVTSYVDANGNGQWDEGEQYSVPYFGPLGDELNLFLLNSLILMADLGPALLDTGPEDLHPLLPDWLPLGDLNYILEALQGWVPGITLPEIPIPVGRWLYNPPEDGLRSTLIAVVQLLYDYTAPTQEAGIN